VNFLCKKWLWYLVVLVAAHVAVVAIANQNHRFANQNHRFASQNHRAAAAAAAAALPLNDFAGIFISANQR
jgi:prophage maintenance system killer protein